MQLNVNAGLGNLPIKVCCLIVVGLALASCNRETQKNQDEGKASGGSNGRRPVPVSLADPVAERLRHIREVDLRVRRYLVDGLGTPAEAARAIKESVRPKEIIIESYPVSKDRCMKLIRELASSADPRSRQMALCVLGWVPDADAQLKAVEQVMPATLRAQAYGAVIAEIGARNPEELWENLDKFPLGKFKLRAAKTYVRSALESPAETGRVIGRLAELDSPDIRRRCIGCAGVFLAELVKDGRASRPDIERLILESRLARDEKERLIGTLKNFIRAQ